MMARCCSSILCRYGPKVLDTVEGFTCPYCYTNWLIGLRKVFGIDRIVYVNESTGIHFILVEHPFGNYLDPSPEQPHPVNV